MLQCQVAMVSVLHFLTVNILVFKNKQNKICQVTGSKIGKKIPKVQRLRAPIQLKMLPSELKINGEDKRALLIILSDQFCLLTGDFIQFIKIRFNTRKTGLSQCAFMKQLEGQKKMFL